jgi:hypothetical protein
VCSFRPSTSLALAFQYAGFSEDFEMSTATSANSVQRANTAPAHTMGAARVSAEPARTLRMGTEEASVLNIDLSGIQIPKVGGLQVDGFKPSFFERLFGKR